MRKSILIAVLLSLILVYPAFGNESADIASNYQFETAIRLSRIVDRQLVFSFVQESCLACQEFKKQILSNTSVKNLLDKHFVLSLIPIDRTFELELPEIGTISNKELAGSLGVEYTPMTYVFYPPEPGLEDNGIVDIPFSKDLNTEKMVGLLNRVSTEAFKKEGAEGVGTEHYNYKTPIKYISKKDLIFIQENMKDDLKVVRKRKKPSEFPQEAELVLNFPLDEPETYAGKVLSKTSIKKVYIVES